MSLKEYNEVIDDCPDYLQVTISLNSRKKANVRIWTKVTGSKPMLWLFDDVFGNDAPHKVIFFDEVSERKDMSLLDIRVWVDKNRSKLMKYWKRGEEMFSVDALKMFV